MHELYIFAWPTTKPTKPPKATKPTKPPKKQAPESRSACLGFRLELITLDPKPL